MKVAIFGRYYNTTTPKSVETLFNYLENQGIEAYIETEFHNLIEKESHNILDYHKYKTFTELDKDFDFLVSIGGDGTILRATMFVKDLGIPIIGINTGRLGFISSVAPDQIDKAVNDVLANNYNINRRTLLTLSSTNNLFKNKNFALNEVAVLKKDTSSMVKIDTFVDDEFLNTYWADGLIISTPTGSTGYSLSCGGPIISPGTNNIIITPIAPHNLNVRPIIINDNSIIKLKVEDRDQLALVALDSCSRAFDSSEELTIKKAKFRINLIEPQGNTFTSTIRSKLMWGSDKRNE